MGTNKQSRERHETNRNEWIDNETVPTLDAFHSLAETRRTIRGFRPEPIPDDVLEQVLSAANQAPSGANSQPWEFLVIRDKEDKETVAEAFQKEIEYKRAASDPGFPNFGNVGSIQEAPAVVIMVGDTRYQQWWPHLLDGSREKMFQHSMAAAKMSLHLAAASAGLGTTWLTTRRPTQSRLERYFDVPDYCRAVATTPIGYPAPDSNPRTKAKVDVQDKIHYGRIDESRLPDIEDIAEGGDKTNWIPRVYKSEDAAASATSPLDRTEE
ncbi:nitroreductase family protein [Saliphagus sp. GCM10025334]